MASECLGGRRRRRNAPIETVRESGRPAALRLLVDLYAAQSLAENGGVHWRRLRLSYEREKLGQQGIYVVWGFTRKPRAGSVPFVEAHMTPGKDREAGFEDILGRPEILTLAGLVEFVGHVVDHDHDEGAVIHPYSWPKGNPQSGNSSMLRHHAALRMLADWQKDKVRDEDLSSGMILTSRKKPHSGRSISRARPPEISGAIHSDGGMDGKNRGMGSFGQAIHRSSRRNEIERQRRLLLTSKRYQRDIKAMSTRDQSLIRSPLPHSRASRARNGRGSESMEQTT